MLVVAAGCNAPEKLDGVILDSRTYIRALQTSPYTCAEHRMLWKVQRRMAGINVRPPQLEQHDADRVHESQASASGLQQCRVCTLLMFIYLPSVC